MGVIFYYLAIFILSILATLVYVSKSSKNSDLFFSLMFVIIPISNMGYLMFSLSENAREAMLANKIIYVGGCFLSLIFMLAMSSMFGIRLPKLLVMTLVGFSFVLYSIVMTAGFSELFYKSVEFEKVDGAAKLTKVYGPAHKLMYVMLIIHMLGGIAMIFYSSLKKTTVSVRTLLLFSLIEFSAIFSYFGQKFIHNTPVELQPVSYLVFQYISLMIMSRTELYDVGRSQASALIEKDENGFLMIDRGLKYLGCNETMRSFFPELGNLRIDSPFRGDGDAKSDIRAYILKRVNIMIDYQDDESRSVGEEHIIERNDKIYRMTVEYIKNRWGKILGYQVFVFDETAERQYTNLLRKYNDELEIEVDKKTEHIQEIQDKMVLGLATMVEGRDASTGGHIRRTSTVVGFLIDEMKKDNHPLLDDEFCRCVIKAAPMHDIGKIAVDDVILRKPGKFTPEEFEVMKTHAAKGAELVKDILADIEEPRFQKIAENVAHYHHERWDGSGYPDGLKGEEIPFEARIMAIADVYDALVSKRCYKEKMSFEKAYEIIEEGMGKHFDKTLNKYFVNSRERLENYYTEEESDDMDYEIMKKRAGNK